ncbi:MAG TPA: high-potential iron-sulfur protein [Polyangiaceae bacterium]|jgi:hypothetical protein|nr:high-potential iron-sulfur protein [Polyangiaceae bacterium]
MDDKLSRRDVLQKSAAFGMLAALGAGACSKPTSNLSCADTTGLSSADAQVRVFLGYVDVSMQPGKACSGCQQYLPGPADACGGCKVLRGTVNPAGYCKSYAPRSA